MFSQAPWRAVVAAALPLALAACGSASPSAGGTSVDVTLQEWAVVPGVATAAAGEVTFNVTNSGPDDVHEFVILRTDLDPGDLPVDADGVVSEEGTGIEVIDEIEDIAVGDTQQLTVTLAAGNYVLLCNIWSADEQEAHYQEGMRIAFTVN